MLSKPNGRMIAVQLLTFLLTVLAMGFQNVYLKISYIGKLFFFF